MYRTLMYTRAHIQRKIKDGLNIEYTKETGNQKVFTLD